MTDKEKALDRMEEIWNTWPTSPDHRQQLVDELAEIQKKWGVGGVREFEALLDAAEEMKEKVDAAIVRLKEIMSMDCSAMSPGEKLKIGCEVAGINHQFKAVDHDCELDTLLEALEALRANLGV